MVPYLPAPLYTTRYIYIYNIYIGNRQPLYRGTTPAPQRRIRGGHSSSRSGTFSRLSLSLSWYIAAGSHLVILPYGLCSRQQHQRKPRDRIIICIPWCTVDVTRDTWRACVHRDRPLSAYFALLRVLSEKKPTADRRNLRHYYCCQLIILLSAARSKRLASWWFDSRAERLAHVRTHRQWQYTTRTTLLIRGAIVNRTKYC